MRGNFPAHTQQDSWLGWWQLAGHDVLVNDQPTSWFVQARSGVPTVLTKPGLPKPGETEPLAPALPDDRAAILDWLADPANLPELGRRRLAPLGDPAARLVIMTDLPEPGDLTAGQLFAGPEGVLLDNMLQAIGLSRADCYIIPLAPGRPAIGRIDQALQQHLAKLARQQLALSLAPVALLFSDAVSRALIGPTVVEARGKLHNVNHLSSTMSAIVTLHPRSLLQQPARKAEAWADLQLLAEIIKQ
jgi:uracil-DNA glycosylase